MESENLTRGRYSAKQGVRSLLERTIDSAELERLKLEDKFRKSQRKCEELEQTVTRLIDEKRVSDDRVKSAEEQRDKLFAGDSKMETEKNKLFFELDEKINELKNENLENERLVGVCQEKCSCLETKMVKMGREIDDLRRENFEANIFIDELKERVNELKGMNIESERFLGVYREKCGTLDTEMVKMGREIDDLRRENAEANRTIDELRLKQSETDKLAEMYKSKLDNLSPRFKNVEENVANMLTMNVGDLANLVTNVRELATRDDGETVIALSPTVHSTCNFTHIGLSSKAAHANGTLALMSGEGYLSKIPPSAGDIIEILDSDGDDGDDEQNKMNVVRSSSSNLRSKRNRTDYCMEDLLASTSTKRDKNAYTSSEDNGLDDDEFSTDSDDSCSDAKMIDLVASLRS